MNISQGKSEKGFTLLEVTLVIIIAGILLSLLASALLTFVQSNRVRTTEFRIEKIEEALTQYLNVNRKYPCPAARNMDSDDTNYGREVTFDCDAGSFAGTVRNNGVRIGAIPNRSLNLPDEFSLDSWGNKFTYAVTENLATTNVQFVPNAGVIRVVDSVGNELVSPPVDPSSRAHYVIVSHGRTGDGAFPLNAVASPPTPCPDASSLDGENCNDDNVFRATLLNSDADLTSFYDDYVAYQGQTTPVLSIPPNAILAFTTATCPEGWTPYIEAEGRFVLGFDPTPNTVDLHLVPQNTTPGVPSETILDPAIAQTSGGDDEAIIPPYVALRYCRKL